MHLVRRGHGRRNDFAVRLTFLLLAWILCCALPTGANAASGFVVYPLKQVIGFDDPDVKRKAPALGAWIEGVTVPRLASDFAEGFRSEFGARTATDIDAQNKSRAVVASLHLVRESQYTVTKMGNVEFHLPITMSIVFTNPNTSELLYTFTDTSYAPVTLAESEVGTPRGDAYLMEAAGRNYQSLLAGLLKKARQGYDPVQVEVSVVKVWKNLCILDKGSKLGVTKGDNLRDGAGNEINVIYETEEYAVAQPLLFKPERGQKFSKLGNKSLASQWKKPKVLSMHDGYKDDELKTIADFFASELSKQSAFTLLSVNDSLSTLLAALGRETNAGQYQITNQRALPDYLIKFTASPLRYYQVREKGKFGFHIYEQYLLGELLDKQGRIVYSAVGSNRIEDEDVGGMVFDQQARREIVLKNAVLNLAEQFSASIRFAHAVLRIDKVKGEALYLNDDAAVLRPNQNVRVFRNLGAVDGVPGDVLVPIWDATVVDVQQGRVEANAEFPLLDELKGVQIGADDVVIVDAITAGKNPAASTSVSYCSSLPSRLGALDIDDFRVISRAPGYLLPYSLYDNDPEFLKKVQESVRYAGFKTTSLSFGAVNTSNRCLLPIHKVTVEKPEPEQCKVSLAVGYRLYAGNEKKGAAASQMKFTLTDVRPPALDQAVQSELSKDATGLLRESIVKVRYQ
jgi:hypothetical protein